MNRRSLPEPPAPRETLRARIRETTADAILAAAEEVFADAGPHAARMDAIAARAGVSVGTLYNHFEDREALLAGLLSARRTELLGKLDAAIKETARRPLRERLRGILGVFLAHCEAHRKFISIALQQEAGRAPPSAQAAAKKLDTMREIHERIAGEMKRGVKEGALRPELGDLGATFLLGMLRALVVRDLVLSPGGDVAGDLDRLLDAFFDGLGARKAKAAA
jgi:AcrR family transcriptional regulator